MATNSLSAMSRREVLEGVDAAFRRAVKAGNSRAGGWRRSWCGGVMGADNTRAGVVCTSRDGVPSGLDATYSKAETGSDPPWKEPP